MTNELNGTLSITFLGVCSNSIINVTVILHSLMETKKEERIRNEERENYDDHVAIGLSLVDLRHYRAYYDCTAPDCYLLVSKKNYNASQPH